MVDVESIVDRRSLEAWLGSLPEQRQREFGAFIASRAALRVLPLALQDHGFWRHNNNFAVLPVIWAGSILEVSQAFSAEHAKLANKACDFTEEIASAEYIAAVSPYASSAISCIGAVAEVIASPTTENVIAFTGEAINSALNAADILEFDLWPSIRADARALENDIDEKASAIWTANENPFAEQWKAAREKMPRQNANPRENIPTVQTHGDWTFWLDWCEGFLEGEPLPKSLLKKILKLPENLWSTIRSSSTAA